MKLSALFAVASALCAYAAPMKRDGPSDTDILQYALTLEHLENNFYSTALAQFSDQDFQNAGYPSWLKGRLSQVGEHEAAHVSLLAGALGSAATQPCTYKFPYTDVKSFINLAHLIENVGVSAYLGAAALISDKTYLTVAGSILTVEARHQAWENSVGLKAQPWQGPFDTPLTLDQVYTIASQFITGCPASNPSLPVKAYGSLAVTGMPGQNVQFTFDDPHTVTNYAVFYSGLGTSVVALDVNDYATIPSNLQGIFYVLISTESDVTKITADNIVAGPAILEAPFKANAQNPAFTG